MRCSGFAGGEPARWALTLILVLLYARIKKEKTLDHFVRGQIYGYLVANPGSTYTQIRERLKLKNGTLTHHLYILERTGFIWSEHRGKYKMFYPDKMPHGTRRGIILSDVQEKIISLIRSSPGIGISDMAKRLNTKKQNISYNVGKLRELGMIRIEGSLRKRCFLNEKKLN